MDDYYFDGDPAVDSTRRQLERLLEGRSARRWPWLVAALAGGTAFAFWRIRSHAAKAPATGAGEAETPPRDVRHAR